MIENISYRYKVPLNITLVVVLTAAVIAATVLGQAWRDLERDLYQNGQSLARVLAHGVAPALLQEDVWGAYETIRAPMTVDMEPHLRPESIMVLDEQDRIYISTDPDRLPILDRPAEADARLAPLGRLLAGEGVDGPERLQLEGNEFLVLLPVEMDGSVLGTVVLGYSRDGFLPRFLGAAQQVLVTTFLILLVLVPAGWWLGRRVAEPLLALSDCMDKLGSGPAEEVTCRLRRSGKDEIGRLNRQFRALMSELQEKEALEREMVRADRLAAIGRLTSGIAHEINNPLGGMLNALNTYKHHGAPDPFTLKTLSLVERGLLQIRDIVGALLVETRLKGEDLWAEDLEDVRTLVAPDIRRKQVALQWDNALQGPVPLPSTPVRQVLINLLLNAVRAARQGGEVHCQLERRDDWLRIRVWNDGDHIPAERMEHLFEPFSGVSAVGNGLGLWVTYQIIEQLSGRIEVQSRPDDTEFLIQLPLGVRREVMP
ncbi:signal transduction histidine kinase [Alkalispirillum mobile]|uniref:histidine kinase n=1 Tax=Alkalispirillum mobile TaxID=85925 RepID=A0A498CGS5_9GAMM|nr:HAMP domain-containing sensor histidine kinase [Alkalispirillum mobile]RLK51531.1 signal transduction histidine kinase [Alkalispirillum mobile]